MQLLIYFVGNDCNFEIQKPLAGANVQILQLNRTLEYISENIREVRNTVGNAVTESLFIIDHHCLVWQFDSNISDQSDCSILFSGGIFHISLGALNEAEGQYSHRKYDGYFDRSYKLNL